jgi:CBS domain containing-hemolysin-like protein
MLMVWLIVLVLIGINALYVSAEFAAVSVRQSRIRQLAGEGHALAAKLLPVLANASELDRYIAACQIGITWSSLVLGAYSQATLGVSLRVFLERWENLSTTGAQTVSAVAVLTAMTTLQVVFGELVPKSLALQFPERAALRTVLPLLWSLKLYSWFLSLLNGSGMAILRFAGFSHTGHRHVHSPEEIDLLLLESSGQGALTPEERSRLHKALRLAARPVRQLMVPRTRISAIHLDLTGEELLKAVIESPYSRLPVYRQSPDNIVGTLHVKDFSEVFLRTGQVPPVESVLRPIVSIPENVRAEKLIALMRQEKTQQALVMDEFGAMIGLVTLGDLLSELLGEFPDEFKMGRSQPERLPDGRVRLPGLMHLDEAREWIGVPWHGEADTVCGHVLNAAGRFPARGERLTIEGVEVEIEAVTERSIASVIATPVIRDGVD